MARIKCRYSIPACGYFGRKKIRLEHDDYWFCDSGDFCPDGCRYEPRKDDACINAKCKHACRIVGEFEKNVKRYEYEDGEDGFLRLGSGEVYNSNELVYLEIDGRIIINEGE